MASAGTSRPPREKPAPRKRPSTKKKPPAQPIVANGMLLVSVFGAFGSRALVEMSTERATELFEQPLSSAVFPKRVIEATAAELETLEKRMRGISQTAIAASALALAYEIENPFNSATSKSMCARELREAMTKLRELVPPADEEDGLDDLAKRRADRQAKAAKPTRPRRRAAT